jgi:hypothetical protein
MADIKGEGDPAKRPNTPPGAMSRQDLFNKSDEAHENNEDFVDVQDEDHDKLTEVSDETEPVEDKREVVPEKKYKVKVNGQDREFTEAELIERASKSEAADQKFQEAARLKREADEKLSQLPKKDVAEPKVEEDDLALARALQMGSEEEAAKVIKRLKDRPTLSEGDVVRKIDERLTFQSSVERFKSEYPELFSDPYLSKLVAIRDEELVKEGDKRPYYDRYKSIGEEMKAWMGNIKPASKKEERKASIVNIKAASGRKVEETDEDEEQSASDIVNQMAKARGQTYAK